MKNQISDEALKATPAVGSSLIAFLMNWDWSTTVGILTAIYVCIQIAYFIWKWIRESKSPSKKGGRQ